MALLIAGTELHVNKYYCWAILLWVVSGASFFVAVVFIVIDNIKSRKEDREKLTQKEKRKVIRGKLGQYLSKGNLLYQYDPNNEASKWASEVEDFLSRDLGDDYISRFGSETGILLENGMEGSIFQARRFLEIRMIRLNEFIREMCLEKEGRNATP